jgi:hypothetical protein
MKEKDSFIVPFSSPLVPTDIPEIKGDSVWRERIFELKSNPDIIVRTVNVRGSIFFEKDKEEVVRIAKREYDLLKTKYHIPVSAQFVLSGKNNNDAVIYGITDRVYEERENREEEIYERAKVAVGLLHYFFDTLQTYSLDTQKMKYFLSDIGFEEQYVYGKTTKDTRNAFRLVDIDPEHISNDMGSFLLSFQDVVETIVDGVVKFLKQRGRSLQEMRDPVQKSMNVLKELEQKGFLENEKRKLEDLRNVVQNVFSDEE